MGINNFGGGPVLITAAAITGNTSGATNMPYQFVATPTPSDATTPITYTWSSDGLVSGQNMPIATYEWTTTGTKTVTVTITNWDGAGSASASTTISLCYPMAQYREAEIREDIVEILEGIDDIGQVHDYVRWSVLYPDVRAQTQKTIDGDRRIRVWMVTCVNVMAEAQAFRIAGTNESVAYTYTYRIRGMFGLKDDDATEKDAMSLALQVIEALHLSDTLHDGKTYMHASLASIDIFEPRMFQNFLAHYVEITQTVTEVIPCLYTGT